MANGVVPDTCFPYFGHKSCPKCPTKCSDDGRDFKAAHICKCTSVYQCPGTDGRNMDACLRSAKATFNFGVCQEFLSYKSGIYTCSCTQYIGRKNAKARKFNKSPCYIEANNNWGSSWGMAGTFKISCTTCDFTPGQMCWTFQHA